MSRELALPYNERVPSQAPQFADSPPVSRAICRELCLPERHVTRRARRLTTSVTMPITPVLEDDFAKARKNNVGSTGEVSPMKPKTIPHRMEHATHCQLRLGVDLRHGRHDSATGFGRDSVHVRTSSWQSAAGLKPL